MDKYTESMDPYKRKGVDKGRLKIDFAHDYYNAERDAYKRAAKKKPELDKADFFDENSGDYAVKMYADSLKPPIDELTGLFRKEFLKTVIESTLKKGKFEAIGLILVDLDLFKWVNEIFGHQLGDKYLAVAASLLLGQLRKGKDIGVRTGGDEIAAVLKDSFTQDAVPQMVRRIHEGLNGKIIPTMVQNLLESKRSIVNENGLRENEGSYWLKYAITELRKLQEDSNKRQKFMVIRGDDSKRKGILEIVDKTNFREFDGYLNGELTNEVETKRIKEKMGNLMIDTFKEIGVSIGGYFVSRKNAYSFEDLQRRAELQISQAKSQGGGIYLAEANY